MHALLALLLGCSDGDSGDGIVQGKIDYAEDAAQAYCAHLSECDQLAVYGDLEGCLDTVGVLFRGQECLLYCELEPIDSATCLEDIQSQSCAEPQCPDSCAGLFACGSEWSDSSCATGLCPFE